MKIFQTTCSPTYLFGDFDNFKISQKVQIRKTKSTREKEPTKGLNIIKV
jgi:hypothetical protein